MTSPAHQSLHFLAQQAYAGPERAEHERITITYHLHAQTLQRLDQQADLQGDTLIRATGRPATWQKILKTSSLPRISAYPPKPSSRGPVFLHERGSYPGLVVWGSLLALIALVLGGVFGIAVTLGRGLSPDPNKHQFALQVSPGSVTMGGTITLRGSNFTSHGRVGLTRDYAIPIVDTGGRVVTESSDSGDITDTVIVGQDWGVGPHVISAEDASSHRIASFPILVTGQRDSLRPAHFELSTNMLDFGSADQATSTVKTLRLTNIGDGQISWQGASTQSWLLVSLHGGTFSHGHSVELQVAVNRSALSPGSYEAQVVFSSTAGKQTLSVKMQVIVLQAGQSSFLQVTPALLAFTANDGAISPRAQTIAVRNPSLLPLDWSTSTSASWLSVSQPTAPLSATSSQAVRVSVNSRALMPGSYSGTVTLHARRPDGSQVSPQDIAVSVTVLPGCSLQLAPEMLTFGSVYLQSAPPARTVRVTSSPSCTGTSSWKANSNASWLHVKATQGTTPGAASVSINTSGLQPGSYTSSLFFSSASSTVTIPVTFTLVQSGTPLLTVSSNPLVFSAVQGQIPPLASQTISLSNVGDRALRWDATAATQVGGDWLRVTPLSGSLDGHSSTQLSATSTVLASLIPGTYLGMITITGTDQTGHVVSGSPQTIPVSLTIVPPNTPSSCTLTTQSPALDTLTSPAGAGTIAKTLTAGVTGPCPGDVTITPTITLLSGNGWLDISPHAVTVTSGTSASFTVMFTTTNLSSGSYKASLTLTAQDTRAAIASSPQTLPVGLTITTPGMLAVSPAALSFTVTGGTTSLPITISNTGSASLNWSAALTQNAPSFLSLSDTTGSNLMGGTSSRTNVLVNARGLPGQGF